MTQALTVRCKLIIPLRFRDRIDEIKNFADACNYILGVAKQEKCRNTTSLHHKVYKATRKLTGLKADRVCQASHGTLSKTHQGNYYINIMVEIQPQPTGKTLRVLGVNLGIGDIVRFVD